MTSQNKKESPSKAHLVTLKNLPPHQRVFMLRKITSPSKFTPHVIPAHAIHEGIYSYDAEKPIVKN